MKHISESFFFWSLIAIMVKKSLMALCFHVKMAFKLTFYFDIIFFHKSISEKREKKKDREISEGFFFSLLIEE